MENLVPSPQALLLQPQGAHPLPAPTAPPAGPAGWSCLGHPLLLTALQLGQPQPVTVLFFSLPPPTSFSYFLIKEMSPSTSAQKGPAPSKLPLPMKLSRARAQPDHELTITACDIPDHRL